MRLWVRILPGAVPAERVGKCLPVFPPEPGIYDGVDEAGAAYRLLGYRVASADLLALEPTGLDGFNFQLANIVLDATCCEPLGPGECRELDAKFGHLLTPEAKA